MALIAGVVIAYVISVFSAISLIRNIIPPLNQAIRITERISQGDLTQQVSVESNNEIGRMLSAIPDMNQSLQRIVGQVHMDSDAIASATTQIAAGNLDLSSRTEQQAAPLKKPPLLSKR